MRPERYLHTVAKRHMATDFTLEAVVEERDVRRSESTLMEAHRLIDAIEASLTEFREDSPVARLNRSKDGEWIEMNAILSEVLELSQGFADASAGYFNPFVKSEGSTGFESLEIDQAGRRVRRKHSGVRLGFGAIGKGYALDRVSLGLLQEGFTDFRLNSGGSSWILSGFDPSGDPWTVGWAWDRDTDGDFLGHHYRLPAGKPIAIGVSGILEQGNHFLFRGKKIAASVKSAFYCGRSGAEADALSTALFVGASMEGESFLTKLENGIRSPSFAYVDLENGLFYNQSFETQFLHEGRIG